jgi:hypothetical protein
MVAGAPAEESAMVSKAAEGVQVHFVTEEEGRKLLDNASRRHLGMSAEEFIRAWDGGEFDDDPDRPEIQNVAKLLPFGRKKSC